MKNSFKYIALLISCIFAACNESAIDPLTGKYPVPVEYTLNELVGQDATKLENGNRVFSLELSGSGGTLSVDFVCDKYYLTSQSYTIATDYSTVGTYTNGVWTATDGSSSNQTLESGTLKVVKNDDNYTISGALTLDNELVIKVNFEGTIVYEPDPEPIQLTQILSAAVSQVLEDGSSVITVKMGTSGITTIAGEYGNTYGGTGNYLSVDFVSTDQTIAAGTYTPAASGSAANGNYIEGYDTEMWGISFTNWGTCWFTLANDVETGIHIEQGDIVVVKKGTIYTITINNGDIYAEYTGKIAALNADDSGESYVYQDVIGDVTSYDWTTGTSSVISGVKYHTITVKEKTAGTVVATFEAVTEESASSLAGTYTIAGSPTAANLMNNGWDGTAYGMGIGGTTFFEDGTQWMVTAGTITVSVTGDKLSFSGSGLTTVSTAGVTGPTELLLYDVEKAE